MKILMFGDIIGEPGRKAIQKILPVWKEKHQPDLIIANGENLAHGAGITEKSLQQITEAGIEVVTSGNHVFDKKEALGIFENKKYLLIRPLNWPPIPYGKGYCIFESGIRRVLIINLNGRVFFRENLDCPFRVVDSLLEELENENYDSTIVDFHAEATSEKNAMGYYLDGRVSAVLGTHTHVQTADERILTGGTAYISDIGMVGPEDSVIGIDKQEALNGFLTQIFKKIDPASGDKTVVNAVLVETDNQTKLAKSIERLSEVIAID
jgi:metallophosphoesterase (TIGR00282 family)